MLPNLFIITGGAGVSGDGSSQGTCPANPGSLKCFTSGECLVCKTGTLATGDVSNGCTSLTSPVCDKSSGCIACKGNIELKRFC